MDQIAFIYGDRFIYWSHILLVLASVGAILLFLALYLGRTGKAASGFLTVTLAVQIGRAHV